MFKENYKYTEKSRFRKYHVLLFTLPHLVKYLRNLHALKTKHDFPVNKSQQSQTAAATRFENTFSSKIADVPVANCEMAECDVADYSLENPGPDIRLDVSVILCKRR